MGRTLWLVLGLIFAVLAPTCLVLGVIVITRQGSDLTGVLATFFIPFLAASLAVTNLRRWWSLRRPVADVRRPQYARPGGPPAWIADARGVGQSATSRPLAHA